MPAYPGDLPAPESFAQQPPGLEGLAALAPMLAHAETLGIVETLPQADTEATTSRPLHDPVVRERLRLLGYLPRRGPRPGNGRVADALRTFQQEADLTVDGWCGPEAWEALQQLVTFESPTRVKHWFNGSGEPLPVLRRALQLRLFALGTAGRMPGKALPALPATGLARFWRQARRLRLAPRDAPMPPLPELATLIFDQDRLLQAVADLAQPWRVNHRQRWRFAYVQLNDNERPRDVQPELSRFLVSMARVELWLLGFSIDIGQALNHPVYSLHGTDRRNGRTTEALRQFWKAFGVRPAPHQIRSITPELFQALTDPEPVAPVQPASDQMTPTLTSSADIAQQARTPQVLDEIWQLGQKLGMKLWDGVRRLWQLLRRGVRRLLDIGRNLARLFMHHALGAFTQVRSALNTLTTSLGQYLRGTLDTPEGVHVSLRLDGDLAIAIAPAASATGLRQAGQQLRAFARSFRRSTRLLALFVRLLRSASAGPLRGWSRLLWLLAHGHDALRAAA